MPIDFEKELNEEQFRAVSSAPGPALVLAGAGSGKTRILTYRVAWLLEEARLPPESLLLLTFTNKAAREMIDRVQTLTQDTRPPYWSGTFHSICGRLLRHYGHHVGIPPDYTILDQSDSESLFTALVKDTDRHYLKDKDNPKPKRLLNLYSYARNTCESFSDLVKESFPWQPEIAPRVHSFAEEYSVRKRAQNVLDFDDLLVRFHDLLKEVAEVREICETRFRCILVDEYQDTNTIQAAIIDMIGGHHNIMAVGDDAQCIYTWRGARFENIQRFPERHPGTRLFKILVNYRSIPPILQVANSVLAMQPAGSGYAKELRSARKGSTLPQLVPLYDSREQARFVAARIGEFYDEGYSLSDIAILYRAHYQAVDLQLELTRQGIPFVITSGVKFFEQAHVKDFTSQLRLLANPKDSSAMERLFGLLPRVGPATVRKLHTAAHALHAKAQANFEEAAVSLFTSASRRPSLYEAFLDPSVLKKVPTDAQPDFEGLMASLIECEAALRRTDPPHPADLVQLAIDGWYGDYIRNVYPDWRERSDDLQALVEFAERFETLSELLTQLVLLNGETADKAVEPEEACLRMTTIHQAKGLEFSIVFLIGAADELLPLKRAIEEGDVEEERRLFYVAITRAMDHLVITHPILQSGRGAIQRLAPSRFIAELPDGIFHKLNTSFG